MTTITRLPYTTYGPALAVILAGVKPDHDHQQVYEWLKALCLVLTDSEGRRFTVEPEDLQRPQSRKHWYQRTFRHAPWVAARWGCVYPAVWGKYVWALLHAVSFLHTATTKEPLTYLLEHVGDVLPCQRCAEDYRAVFAASPKNLDTRQGCVKCVCALHDAINSKLSKPVVVSGAFTELTLEDALENVPKLLVPAAPVNPRVRYGMSACSACS